MTLIQTCASISNSCICAKKHISTYYLCILVPCPRYSFGILLGDEMVKRHKATFSASGTFEVAPAKHLKEIDSLFDPFTKHLGTFSNRSFCNKGSVFTYQKNKNPKLKLKTPKSKFLETIFFFPPLPPFSKTPDLKTKRPRDRHSGVFLIVGTSR